MKREKLYQTIDEEQYQHVVINSNEPPNNGLVFLYPSWSIDQILLPVLLRLLKKENSNTKVYVYDIDDESFLLLTKVFNIKSNGKSEIFCIKDAKVVDALETYSKNRADDIQWFLQHLKIISPRPE